MKDWKAFGTGLGAAAVSVLSSNGLAERAGKCTQTCDACGGACLLALAGIGTIGALAHLMRKTSGVAKPS